MHSIKFLPIGLQKETKAPLLIISVNCAVCSLNLHFRYTVLFVPGYLCKKYHILTFYKYKQIHCSKIIHVLITRELGFKMYKIH